MTTTWKPGFPEVVALLSQRMFPPKNDERKISFVLGNTLRCQRSKLGGIPSFRLVGGTLRTSRLSPQIETVLPVLRNPPTGVVVVISRFVDRKKLSIRTKAY